MIGPRTIAQMIDAGRLHAVRDAIVAKLDGLLVGVTVIGHPGKLDINDVVAKAVVKAPGVAIGWTSTRCMARPGGTFDTMVDWAAYIVVEDVADLAARRKTNRDAVGHAIGSTILEILADPEVASWGRLDVDRPSQDPGPQLVPMFTARSFEAGTAYYAATWRQPILDQGEPMFGDGSVAIRRGEDGLPEVEFDEDGGLPAEIQAMMRQANGSVE